MAKAPLTFEIAARTDVGLTREVNQDAFLSRPDLGIWAVADGMGGHLAGEVASRKTVEALAGGPLGEGLEPRVMEALRRLARVNGELIDQGRSCGGTVGTTVVALVIEGSDFACLWAGDSRGYLLRDGELVQLSHDHSLVQELVDSGELDADKASLHAHANIVTRAVGADEELEVDAVEGDIRPGDVFLLASDGLTRIVADAELQAALVGPDLEAVADRLLETCLGRGAPDNVTFVLLRPRPAGG